MVISTDNNWINLVLVSRLTGLQEVLIKTLTGLDWTGLVAHPAGQIRSFIISVNPFHILIGILESELKAFSGKPLLHHQSNRSLLVLIQLGFGLIAVRLVPASQSSQAKVNHEHPVTTAPVTLDYEVVGSNISVKDAVVADHLVDGNGLIDDALPFRFGRVILHLRKGETVDVLKRDSIDVEKFRSVGGTVAGEREREGEMDARYKAGNQLSLDVAKGIIVHGSLGVEEFLNLGS